jgi:hypothetical protein
MTNHILVLLYIEVALALMVVVGLAKLHKRHPHENR